MVRNSNIACRKFLRDLKKRELCRVAPAPLASSCRIFRTLVCTMLRTSLRRVGSISSPRFVYALCGPMRVPQGTLHTGSVGTLRQPANPTGPTPMSKLKDDFLDANSLAYLESLEQQGVDDPSSVHRTWSNYLSALGSCLTVQHA